MRAVVLAGGQDFGQSPLSRQAPRALWPLVDRPIIEHVLRTLHAAGIGDMAISANGRTHDIATRLGRNPSPGITVHYSEDSLPRGAAGCLKDCEQWLGSGTCLVIHGASLLLNVDLDALLAEHRRSGAVMTVAVSADGARNGDSYTSLALCPTGLYVCESEVFAFIKQRGYQDMKEQLIPRLIEAGLTVRAAPIRGRIIPVLNEESYLNAMIEVLENPEQCQSLTAHLPSVVPTIWKHPEAEVAGDARIVGPVWIGLGARLEDGAIVIGPAVIGANCRIGAHAIVHQAILWEGAKVGRGAMVEQAVMAAGASVRPGAEVRGAIVVESSLSVAERQTLGGSMNFLPVETGPPHRWWGRLREKFRPISLASTRTAGHLRSSLFG